MTTCDGGVPSAVFAHVPGAAGTSRLDEESDCRWCSILLGPGSVAEPAPKEREHLSGERTERRTTDGRAGGERYRPAILLMAALTVLAALALVAKT